MNEHIEVHNPATGTLVSRVDTVRPRDVAPAADRARAAQPSWAARTWRSRMQVFATLHDLLLERSEQVLDTIQHETGKSRRDALAELITVAGTIRYYLAHGRAHLRGRRARGGVPLVTRAHERWHPHGLVGLITPWNFPFLLGVGDALPALMAGNAVLTKPSELTPLSTLLARDLLCEAGLDADLFQPLVGTGAALGHPLIESVDFIGFTGSTDTGRIVAQAAAERLIPCSLELGGKNPMLILPGTRISDAVHGLVSGGFANGGQTCIASERVYVHADVWDAFTVAARERVETLRVGWSTGWDVDLGSMVSEQHAAKVRHHIADARAHGATVLAGGDEPHPAGPAFVRPTLLTGAEPSMLLHADETFGPVARLERVASIEEAIERANESHMGLNASVWSGSRRLSRRVAQRVEVGAANINSTLLIYHSFDVPMGGIRRSGMGRRHGAAGIQRFARQQSIVESFARWGGYELLLRVITSRRRARILLRLLRAWRHLPGLR